MPRPARTARTLAAPFAAMALTDARKTIAAAMGKLSAQVHIFALDRQGSAIKTIADGMGLSPLIISRAFLQGDHWQNGFGWIGPRPQIGDAAYTETMTEIARMFISKNVIAEVVNRHVNGVVGIEPHFGLAWKEPLEEGDDLPPEVATLIDEAEALLTTWWDERRMHSLLQQAVTTLLYAERAMLRLYIPRGLLVDVPNELPDGTIVTGQSTKVIEASDAEDALAQIYADHPAPEFSTVAQDPDTKEYVGVVIYKTGQTVEGVGSIGESCEITYLEGDREKPITVLVTDGTTGRRAFSYDWAGQLPMFEMQRPLFVTPQMWQGQRALNLALSMIPRGNVTAGFLERTIMNAQMPGAWETDPTTGRRIRFVPAPYYTGAGTTNFLQGAEIQDPETGHVQLATPSVHIREPVSSSPLIESARSHYADMLEEASQEHTLAYTNTHASGKTHEQARADFTTSLGLTKARVEQMGRWLLTALLAMAENIGGEPGKYTATLRPVFSCRIDTGPISAAERTANDASMKAGTLSLETTLVRNGEPDPDAELQRIQKAPGAGLALIERQAAVILQLTQSGSSLKGAAMFAGVDDTLVAELVKDQQEAAPPELPPNPDGSFPPQ